MPEDLSASYVQKATPAQTEEILDLLEDFRNPLITREKRRRILTYRWGQDEDYRGLALMAGGKVVGYLGLIFSHRVLDGRPVKFCSLTNWIVKKEFRNYGLLLIHPLARMNEYVLTNFSCYPEGIVLMKRLGFRELDVTARFIPCLPKPGAGGRRGSWKVSSDPRLIREVLNEADRKIYEDHQPYRCVHQVLHGPQGRYCYMVFTERKKMGLKYYFVNYLSDTDLFLEHLDRIRFQLLWRRAVSFLLVDDRYLQAKPLPFHFLRRLSPPRLVKCPPEIQPVQVDSLYSEWVLLQ